MKLRDHPIHKRPLSSRLCLMKIPFQTNDERHQRLNNQLSIWSSFTEIANLYQCCDVNPPCLTKRRRRIPGFNQSFYFSKKNLLAAKHCKQKKTVLSYSTNEIKAIATNILWLWVNFFCDCFGLLFIFIQILISYEKPWCEMWNFHSLLNFL